MHILRQLLDIHLGYEACRSMLYHVANGAHLRGYTRNAGRHCLQDNVRHAFSIRGQEEDVGGADQFAGVWDQSEKVDGISQTELFHMRLNVLLVPLVTSGDDGLNRNVLDDLMNYIDKA
jgi:hypothetical protein